MKNLKPKLENNLKTGIVTNLVSIKGITLISLIITIIILIIIAGVTINLSLGKNGMLTTAKQAKEETNKQTATEQINLKITTAQVNKYAEEQRMLTLKELSVALGEDEEIEYVTEKSQMASTKYEVGENPNSIFTKLNKYSYEFEINSFLQLASINGIKVAQNNDSTTALVPKLLWKNPNPNNTNGFEAQTITIKENNCDVFEIYYLVSCTERSMMSEKCIKENDNISTLLNTSYPAVIAERGTVSNFRKVTINSNISVTFGDSYRGHTGVQQYVNNTDIIPVYILGYETGLFTQN